MAAKSWMGLYFGQMGQASSHSTLECAPLASVSPNPHPDPTPGRVGLLVSSIRAWDVASGETISSHRKCVLISFRTPTPPQDRELIVSYGLSKYQVERFVGGLTFSNELINISCQIRSGFRVDCGHKSVVAPTTRACSVPAQAPPFAQEGACGLMREGPALHTIPLSPAYGGCG